MIAACRWLSGVPAQILQGIKCLSQDAQTACDLSTLIPSVSKPGSEYLPRGHECQLSFSLFHNLGKDWFLELTITLDFHRTILIRAEVRVTNSLHTIFTIIQNFLKESIQRLKLFHAGSRPRGKKKKSCVITCRAVYLAIFSYSFFPISINKTCQNSLPL